MSSQRPFTPIHHHSKNNRRRRNKANTGPRASAPSTVTNITPSNRGGANGANNNTRIINARVTSRTYESRDAEGGTENYYASIREETVISHSTSATSFDHTNDDFSGSMGDATPLSTGLTLPLSFTLATGYPYQAPIYVNSGDRNSYHAQMDQGDVALNDVSVFYQSTTFNHFPPYNQAFNYAFSDNIPVSSTTTTQQFTQFTEDQPSQFIYPHSMAGFIQCTESGNRPMCENQEMQQPAYEFSEVNSAALPEPVHSPVLVSFASPYVAPVVTPPAMAPIVASADASIAEPSPASDVSSVGSSTPPHFSAAYATSNVTNFSTGRIPFSQHISYSLSQNVQTGGQVIYTFKIFCDICVSVRSFNFINVQGELHQVSDCY